MDVLSRIAGLVPLEKYINIDSCFILHICSITPHFLGCTSYSEEELSYRWVINGAEKVILQASKDLRSPSFTVSGLDGEWYMHINNKWGQDQIQYLTFSLCCPTSNKLRDVWISNCSFSILDSSPGHEKRTIFGKDMMLITNSVQSYSECIPFKKNEPLEKYLHNGILTIQVTATLTFLNKSVESVSQCSVVPEHKFSEQMNLMCEEELFTDVALIGPLRPTG